jgi:hypothetical protein
MVPSMAFIGLLFIPLALAWPTHTKEESNVLENEADAWAYHRLAPLPLDALFTLGVYLLTQDVFVATATAILFVPLYRAQSALNAWPWAAAGVMLGLGLAWSQFLPIFTAGVIVLVFVLPWLLAPQTDDQSTFDWTGKKEQLQLALWGSVILVSLYLVLTWVLLLASIDAVNFEAHELYGAPFLAALGAASFLYTRRKDDQKETLQFLFAAVLISVLGIAFAPNAFGRDASTMVSEHLTRGHIVWISLPMLTLACAPMLREVKREFVKAKGRGSWKRIPLGAHIVHLGLLVLLLGHLSTTVLVDRGDSSHRLSLIKDEVIVHEGLGFEFEELILENEGLEVGDGFIGVRITVYEMDGTSVGPIIGEVTPGTLRFDSQGIPRSEVATLTRLTGDVVFIFDGSQAGALMSTAQSGSMEDIQLIRVTVYDLPHSHAVWLGWSAMMFGMALVAWAGASNGPRAINGNDESGSEEE